MADTADTEMVATETTEAMEATVGDTCSETVFNFYFLTPDIV
jgi:hypothetical protein